MAGTGMLCTTLHKLREKAGKRFAKKSFLLVIYSSPSIAERNRAGLIRGRARSMSGARCVCYA